MFTNRLAIALLPITLLAASILAAGPAQADGSRPGSDDSCYQDVTTTTPAPLQCDDHVVTPEKRTQLEVGLTRTQVRHIVGSRGDRVYLLDHKLLKLYPGTHRSLYVIYLQSPGTAGKGGWHAVDFITA